MVEKAPCIDVAVVVGEPGRSAFEPVALPDRPCSRTCRNTRFN